MGKDIESIFFRTIVIPPPPPKTVGLFNFFLMKMQTLQNVTLLLSNQIKYLMSFILKLLWCNFLNNNKISIFVIRRQKDTNNMYCH